MEKIDNKNLLSEENNNYDIILPLSTVLIGKKTYSFPKKKDSLPKDLFYAKLSNKFIEIVKVQENSKKDSEQSFSLKKHLVKDIIGIHLQYKYVKSSKEVKANEAAEWKTPSKGSFIEQYQNYLNSGDKEELLFIEIQLRMFPLVRQKTCGFLCCCCRDTVSDRHIETLSLFYKLSKDSNNNNDFEEINTFLKRATMNLSIEIKSVESRNYSNSNTNRELSHLSIGDQLVLPVKKKLFLIYINPIGGKGIAMKNWESSKDLFIHESSFVDIEVFFTKYYKHSYDNTLQISDKTKYDGILCCSGDGIVHEVLNAIMHKREEPGFEDFDLSVGVIPSGTSNGLSKALCVESGENSFSLNLANYLILRRETKRIDLCEIEMLNQKKKVYSFLSVTWGFVADVDLESEVLRCLGEMRLYVWAIWRLLNLRKYNMSVSYLKEECEGDVISHDSSNFCTTIKPEYTLNSYYNKLKSADIKNKEQTRKESDTDSVFDSSRADLYYFALSNLSHISVSINAHPLAVSDDGNVDILLSGPSSNSSRCQFTKFLLLRHDAGDLFTDSKKRTKENLDSKLGVQYRKTKVFRMIPKINANDSDLQAMHLSVNGDQSGLRKEKNYMFKSHISLDGEKYDVQPLQIVVLNKAIKVFGYKSE